MRPVEDQMLAAARELVIRDARAAAGSGPHDGDNDPMVRLKAWAILDAFDRLESLKDRPQSGLIAAVKNMADEVQNVVGADGEFLASERIKDWFSFDTLENLLDTAESLGWKRRDPE